MRKSVDEIYNTHKDHDLMFNHNVVSSLGIIPERVQLKCGDIKIPCAIYSSSMVGGKVIAKLNRQFFNNLNRSSCVVAIHLIYIDKESSNEVSFFINSKITLYNKFSSEKPNIYYISIDYINKPPDDLIYMLGNHILKQIYFQKRAVKRFVLNPLITEANIMEQYLFKSGKGKKCLLTEVSLFSAKILISGHENEFSKNDNVLLLIKSVGVKGIGEMMGHITRVEHIDQEEGLFSIVIVFNQEMIPPVYKMWLADCIDVVKPDQPRVTHTTVYMD